MPSSPLKRSSRPGKRTSCPSLWTPTPHSIDIDGGHRRALGNTPQPASIQAYYALGESNDPKQTLDGHCTLLAHHLCPAIYASMVRAVYELTRSMGLASCIAVLADNLCEAKGGDSINTPASTPVASSSRVQTPALSSLPSKAQHTFTSSSPGGGAGGSGSGMGARKGDRTSSKRPREAKAGSKKTATTLPGRAH